MEQCQLSSEGENNLPYTLFYPITGSIHTTQFEPRSRVDFGYDHMEQ